MHVLGVQLKKPEPLDFVLACAIGGAVGVVMLVAARFAGIESPGSRAAAWALACAWGSLAASMGASVASPGGRVWQKFVITGMPAVVIGWAALIALSAAE